MNLQTISIVLMTGATGATVDPERASGRARCLQLGQPSQPYKQIYQDSSDFGRFHYNVFDFIKSGAQAKLDSVSLVPINGLFYSQSKLFNIAFAIACCRLLTLSLFIVLVK